MTMPLDPTMSPVKGEKRAKIVKQKMAFCFKNPFPDQSLRRGANR